MRLTIWATHATLFSALLSVSLLGCSAESTDDRYEDNNAAIVKADRVEAARADLDALYKGDYRSAFVDKDPSLFLRHIHDDFASRLIDGSTGNAQVLREFFPVMVKSVERVIDHNVTIEDIQLKADRIEAVVTLTTVMDRRSPTNVVYNEISVGTYRDVFVRGQDGTLLEIAGDQLRLEVTGAPRP